MSTTGTDALHLTALEATLGPHLTADQAAFIFKQGQEAVLFALLSLAKQLAEKPTIVPTTPGTWPSNRYRGKHGGWPASFPKLTSGRWRLATRAER
jgi:hypothetical protein